MKERQGKLGGETGARCRELLPETGAETRGVPSPFQTLRHHTTAVNRGTTTTTAATGGSRHCLVLECAAPLLVPLVPLLLTSATSAVPPLALQRGNEVQAGWHRCRQPRRQEFSRTALDTCGKHALGAGGFVNGSNIYHVINSHKIS